jgi:HK97 family phage portal protein
MWPFGRREEKRSITAIDGYWPDYSEPTNQFGHVTVSRAMSLIPVFAAVRLLADAISSMPLLLLKRDERGIPQRQPTPSLFSQPSVHGTTVDWVHRAVVSMALQGDAIGLITQRDFYNYPTMIEWLNPENVATHDGKLEGPGSYINPLWWWWGRPVNPANLLHIPWFTMPWRVRGLSPIGAYQLTVNRGIGAAEYSANWYANGGVPPGVFRNNAKTIEEKDATQLTSRFMARLQSRKPLVTGMDWEFTPIAIKPHEAQFIETERMSATQIATVYGIPPERIGGTTGNSLTYCADTETEILTLRGWLRYDQVTVDDTALTLNTDTGMAEWQPVQAVNVFDGSHEVVKMENTGHSSVTTLNHRWPVTFLRHECAVDGCTRDTSTKLCPAHYQRWRRNGDLGVDIPVDTQCGRPAKRNGGLNWQTTQTLSGDARICAAAPVVAPTEPKWSDALVELIGWFWTEGWIGKYGSVTIAQSQAVNSQNVTRIRAALTEVIGRRRGMKQVRAYPSWREDIDSRGLVHFRLNKKAGAFLLLHAPQKVVSTEFLAQLTRAQLELFIQTSIDADGWRRKGGAGTAVIAQKDRARLDAFQIACTMAGKSGQVRQQKSGMWCMSITSNPWRKPANHLKDVEHMVIDGLVWCPTTANKTWFARRNGTVYATGNSTVEQNTIDLLTFCLHPWMVKFEAALSNCFPRGYYVRCDPSDMLRVDAETQAKIDQTSLGFQAPAWMEVDEVRANRDLPPMKNPPKPAGQDQTQPAQTKQNVLVPGRPADGPSQNGNGQHRSYNGREELARLESMRQRWTNGAHVAMKGS